MNKIGLKINGIWCVLPQDVSISIEEQNPLFSDIGSFSYPIEMNVSQNRELFKSIDSPHGRIRPQDLDGLPFELWYDGVMLLYGSTETDEDLDIEEDKCSVNLVSGNGDFQSKIDGMQCTDVPLLDDIFLGYVSSETRYYNKNEGPGKGLSVVWDENHTMSFNNVNVSEPYPLKQFCNTRICVARTDDYNHDIDVPFWVYDADRPWSGVCFYVAYFIKCLISHLGIFVKEDHLLDVEDMGRLAFFTTKCEYKYGKTLELGDNIYYPDNFKEYAKKLAYVYIVIDKNTDIKYIFKEIYATNKNFPEESVSTVIKSLFNAFGVKFIYDSKVNEVSIYYIRDILRDNTILNTELTVNNLTVSYEKREGVRLTYNGDEDDESFVYNEWERIKVEENFNDIIKQVGVNNMNLYVNSKTGMKYRIKVEEDAVEEGDVTKLYPSLFEVAQFNDFIIGEKTDNVTDLEISFSPVIENDVTVSSLKEQGISTAQRLACLVDVSMKGDKGGKVFSLPVCSIETGEKFGDVKAEVTYNDPQWYDPTQDNPLRKYSSGFTLGIMRGPGSESGTEVFLENYDGNGNDAWTTVVADYAFTADTMDAYGNRYDYNGTAEGGVADQENTISLKTHIQTAKDIGLKNEDGTEVDWGIDDTAAKRGLADRFMSEYMYFLLHCKVVKMGVDTTLSYLTSLSWFKQLRINDTVGRLKSRSYTISNKGVTNMNIELYTIN